MAIWAALTAIAALGGLFKKEKGITVNTGGGAAAGPSIEEQKRILDQLMQYSDYRAGLERQRTFADIGLTAERKGVSGAGPHLRLLGDIGREMSEAQAQGRGSLALQVFQAGQQSRLAELQLQWQRDQAALQMAQQQSLYNQQNRAGAMGALGQLAGLYLSTRGLFAGGGGSASGLAAQGAASNVAGGGYVSNWNVAAPAPQYGGYSGPWTVPNYSGPWRQ